MERNEEGWNHPNNKAGYGPVGGYFLLARHVHAYICETYHVWSGYDNKVSFVRCKLKQAKYIRTAVTR